MIARLDVLVWRNKVRVRAELFILLAPASDWGSSFTSWSLKLQEEFTGAGWQKTGSCNLI